MSWRACVCVCVWQWQRDEIMSIDCRSTKNGCTIKWTNDPDRTDMNAKRYIVCARGAEEMGTSRKVSHKDYVRWYRWLIEYYSKSHCRDRLETRLAAFTGDSDPLRRPIKQQDMSESRHNRSKPCCTKRKGFAIELVWSERRKRQRRRRKKPQAI